MDQWWKLGGHGGWLQKLNWRGVEAYLQGLSPDRRFEIKVIRKYSCSKNEGSDYQ
jgi:hypothetical protein